MAPPSSQLQPSYWLSLLLSHLLHPEHTRKDGQLQHMQAGLFERLGTKSQVPLFCQAVEVKRQRLIASCPKKLLAARLDSPETNVKVASRLVSAMAMAAQNSTQSKRAFRSYWTNFRSVGKYQKKCKNRPPQSDDTGPVTGMDWSPNTQVWSTW